MKTYNFGSTTDPDPYDQKILGDLRETILLAVETYVQTGRQPGDFLTAVIDNNLREALGRADADSRRSLHNLVRLLYNYCPGCCWGSPEKRKAWTARGGILTMALEIQSTEVTPGLRVNRRGYPLRILEVTEIIFPEWKDAPRDNPEVGLRGEVDQEEEGLFLLEFIGADSPYRKVAP